VEKVSWAETAGNTTHFVEVGGDTGLNV
jgi:hypothetical protein